MSKESIRKQIDKLKSDSTALLSSRQMSDEIRVFISSMMAIIDIIVAVLLEKKTRKNSSNSGLPPSRNNGSNGNRNIGNVSDRDKKGSQLSNTRAVNTAETVSPAKCSDCSADLTGAKVKKIEERKIIDIIYEVTTHTIASETVKCPDCGTVNKGKFPSGIDGKIQYGMGIKATIINYLIVQMMSLERVQEHLMGVIGRFISQAVMLKYIAQISDSLQDWEEKQIERLLSCPAIHCDETSIKINKENQWIHSYSYGNITLKIVHQKRGTEAMDEINIIPRYGGILVHDCWGSYLSYAKSTHALCGSHLLRDLKFVEDATGDKWATKMKKLLLDAAKLVAKRKVRKLTKKEYERLQSRYRNCLTRAEQELPPFPEQNNKRGRIKHTDAQNLWIRMKKYEDSILMFAVIREVEFTNNRAERDLRMSKVKQKVSGCFRTVDYAKHYCRISSYIQSMRYRGYSAFEAIMLVFQGKIPSEV